MWKAPENPPGLFSCSLAALGLARGAGLLPAESDYPISLLVRIWHDQAARSANQRQRFLGLNSRVDQRAGRND